MKEWSAIGVAALAFISTNVDDIVLLAALFSDPTIRRRSIVIGQVLGMGVLTAASCVAARLALNIPPGWVALLGVVPLALGILKLRSLRGPVEEDGEVPVLEHRAEQRVHSQVLAVSGITIANGGDNLGVYIPLFASTSFLLTFIVVFAVMTLGLCAVGYYAVNNPLFGGAARHYGRIALPYVLIALGVYILAGAVVPV